MGFEDWEIDCLFKNAAGQMHMGEMKFKQRPREEQAEPDGDEGQFAFFRLWLLFFCFSHAGGVSSRL